jgi:hypothetical protein
MSSTSAQSDAAGGTVRSRRRAAALSAGLGALTLVTGLYFMFMRPPMLPEDIRFTGVSAELLGQRFTAWLSILFRAWGGFMVGFGIFLASLGAFLWKGDVKLLRGGAAASTRTRR